MDKNNEMSDQKLNMLIGIVSKKIGVPPDTLRAKLADGSFDSIVKNISPTDAKKVASVVEDPSKINSILKDPDTSKKLGDILGKTTKR